MMRDPAVKLVTVAAFRERFGCSSRRAKALMRRMRHLRDGREIWTTEEWLAEYVAAQALPGSHWPKFNRKRDPIDEDLVQMAIELVGRMADRGTVKICAVQ